MTTLDTIRQLDTRFTYLVRNMHKMHLAHKPARSDQKYYTMQESARLIGKTYRAIRDAELAGHIENPVPTGKTRPRGYSLAEINRARDHFKTRITRNIGDPTIVLPFSSFKGGSGKTTSAIHFSQYAAEAGLRVLLIDVDPQATTTAMFGYMPDEDIDSDSTIQPYMEGTIDSLAPVVRETSWEGLSLIPSNLEVFGSEYVFASDASRDLLQRLRHGIQSVENDFDIIIIDPPPSLGMLSLSVMHAANALIIPMPAAIPDVFSTKAYITMLVQTLESLDKYGFTIDYHFVRLMVTRLDENSETQQDLVEVLPDLMGNGVLRNSVRKTAALDRATGKGRTLYEVTSKDVSSKVLRRGLNYFNKANDEILTLVRQCWPSHQEMLRDAGV